MSSVITESLKEIAKLTQQNLKILMDINNAFYSKKNHISTEINGERVVIPSFLSLESKIDTLQQDLENLLNAPKTGEAFISFDGNTQRIELSGYDTTPPSVNISPVKNFYVNKNSSIFKDFLSPNPYIRLDLSSISNNIKNVNIKKIVIKNTDLITRISNLHDFTYSDLYKILYAFDADKDYEEYNFVKRLPLRDKIATGEYIIKRIISSSIDSNFDSLYSLELNNPLTYFINNGTIERDLNIGDQLVTNNGKVKMIIENLNRSSKIIDVRIMYGAYADISDMNSSSPDMFTLRYINDSNITSNKFIDVPLEEDKYVCVFVSPINDTTNTVAPFGKGIFIDVDTLTYEDEQGNTKFFRSFYDEFVNNIGDALYNITKMMDDDEQVERLSLDEFNLKTSAKPIIESNKILVSQINKHLDDSESIKKIRHLYSQKINIKSEIDRIQLEIDDINNKINDTSFDNTNGIRQIYIHKLEELRYDMHNAQQSLNDIVQSISQSANESETPIENAKYRIRGFVPVSNDTIKIDVEYRYKNKNKFTGNAITIGNDLIYSDWNKMQSIYKLRTAKVKDGKIIYENNENNENKNEISFNQLDIPISQGEQVDVRVRYLYKYGYPFIEMYSDWCDIFTIDFPVEYLKNVEILDIIAENNDDIKKNQFNNILDKRGVSKHVEDNIIDDTTMFFHKAENIASGFFTDERKVIPLYEKLQEFSSLLTDLQTEVYGGDANNLMITVTDNKNSMTLLPNIVNIFKTQDYSSNTNKVEIPVGQNASNAQNKPFAYSQLMLSIYNNSKYNIKLHSLFPGSNTDILSNSNQNSFAFDINNYIVQSNNANEDYGVWMQLDEENISLTKNLTTNNNFQFSNPQLNDSQLQAVYKHNNYGTPQLFNQYLYFRTKDSVTNNPLYASGYAAITKLSLEGLDARTKLPKQIMNYGENNLLPLRDFISDNSNGENASYATLFPYIGQLSNITIENGQSFKVLRPGDSINIPLSFYYYFNISQQTKKADVYRIIEFDLRTSLFRDPINFRLVVSASNIDMKAFKEKSVSDFSMLDVNTNVLKKYSNITPKTWNK